MKNIIHIFGASGSGTSTLGRAVAEKTGYAFLDSDDYIWAPTDPPFTSRPYRCTTKAILSFIRAPDYLGIPRLRSE